MPADISDLDARKYSLAREIFVDTADDNYILARLAYRESLNVDFNWLAVHALEKYYKAALLINGRSGKNFTDKSGKRAAFGHNIVLLHEQLMTFAAELLPFAMIAPNCWHSNDWHAESTDAFLDRLYRDGNADNRYQLFGYSHHPGEIHKLDCMVFAVRRLCIPLDAYYLNKSVRATLTDNRHHFSHRDLLIRQPDYWEKIGGKLADAISGRRGPFLHDIVMHENFAFAESDSYPKMYQIRSSSHDSAIWRNILLPMEQGDKESRDIARALGIWMTENVHLPDDVRKQLTTAIKYPS